MPTPSQLDKEMREYRLHVLRTTRGPSERAMPVSTGPSPVVGSGGVVGGPFLLGSSYLTKGGRWVRIVDETTVKGYECVKGDDDVWRYNRASCRGRTTGADADDHRNLLLNGSDQPPARG